MPQLGNIRSDLTTRHAAAAPTEVLVAVVPDPKKSLTDLKELFDAGIITQAEFDSKKAELLARM